MRVDTSIVGYEFKMIFTEKTFSLCWQLQITMAYQPSFFWLQFFSRLVVIIMQCYRLIFLFVTCVECHIFSFFPGHAKIESWIIGRVFRFRENSANR